MPSIVGRRPHGYSQVLLDDDAVDVDPIRSKIKNCPS
eukprot:SAG11_NODE_28187_length_324_cov_1.151111_1_plen_36_part_10